MSIIKANKETMTVSKEKKMEVMDKAFLVFRLDDLPQLLRPICARKDYTCALTGKLIERGDYCYPCNANPVRLNVYGNERVQINAALKEGNKILPKGYFALQVPPIEDVVNRVELKKAEEARRKQLAKAATKLLKAGR